jgi:hypothetical protein
MRAGASISVLGLAVSVFAVCACGSSEELSVGDRSGAGGAAGAGGGGEICGSLTCSAAQHCCYEATSVGMCAAVCTTAPCASPTCVPSGNGGSDGSVADAKVALWRLVCRGCQDASSGTGVAMPACTGQQISGAVCTTYGVRCDPQVGPSTGCGQGYYQQCTSSLDAICP